MVTGMSAGREDHQARTADWVRAAARTQQIVGKRSKQQAVYANARACRVRILDFSCDLAFSVCLRRASILVDQAAED
ncbi:hypothetical protein, partial [Actinoallomurus sp. NPDC050550]|uniref:hypothetical protein n=1 Tax=Actinoallomurus sp. NPDC050550 TaxID=3154937 RepID=UPI0033F83594